MKMTATTKKWRIIKENKKITKAVRKADPGEASKENLTRWNTKDNCRNRRGNSSRMTPMKMSTMVRMMSPSSSNSNNIGNRSQNLNCKVIRIRCKRP